MAYKLNPFSGLLDYYDPSSGGTVTSVSGTANRITVTNGTTAAVVDIAATYVGQTSITTLGTVVTGVWNGTSVDLAHGGTNANLTASNGGIFYSTAAAGAILAGTATAGQVLQSGSSSAPSWTSTLANIVQDNITRLGTVTTGVTFSGLIQNTGGICWKRTATAVSYQVLVTDIIIAVTDTSAARTITMPNAGLTSGQVWVVKDESLACSVNNITISGNGANILGTTSAATYVMNNNGASVSLYYNGTNFVVM